MNCAMAWTFTCCLFWLSRMLREVTCYQATVTSMDFAYDQIDTAIAAALSHSKPVLIQVGGICLFQTCKITFDMEKTWDINNSLMYMCEASSGHS